jgi:hypothetical protein
MMTRSQIVTVDSDGGVLFPESFREEMGLRPGDILSVVGAPLFFSIDLYREMLEKCPAFMDQSTLMDFVLFFLARPLTVVEEDHRVFIPEEAYPLRAGSQLTVYLDGDNFYRLDFHRLRAFVDI